MNSLFANPGILWALLGIAIPIWLHFYQNKTKQKVYFSDLRLLSAYRDLSKGRKEWEKLLLLFLRILALICLILAFSQPKWSFFSKRENVQGIPTYYLDNHPSLVLGNRKKYLALKDQISGSSSKIRFFNNDFNSSDFETIPLSELKSNWSKVLPSIQNPPQGSIKIHAHELSDENLTSTINWISDFPKNKDLPQLKGETQYRLLPLARKLEENIIVDSIWVADGFIQARDKFKLSIRLKTSLPSNSAKTYTLRFYLNNFLLSNQSFSFTKKRFCELNFDVSLPSIGEFPAHFMIDDEVDFDNKYHMILRTSHAQKVYFISKENQRTEMPRVFQSDSLFDFEQISKEKWLSLNNSSGAFVIMHGLESFTSTEWQMVLQRLSAGQSMLVIPESGSNYQAISYLSKLSASTGGKLSITTPTLGLSIIQPDLKKSFFNKIIEANSKGENVKTWSSSTAWNLPKSSNSILFTSKGYSYLEKCKVNKGNLFLFSGNVLDEKNAFLKHGLFLPIFQELVLQNSPSAKLNLTYSRDEFQVFPDKYFRMENLEKQVLKLKNRNGEFVLEQEWRGDHWNCRLPSSIEAGEFFNGIYSVFSGKEKVGLLAINFPKEESVIDSYSAKDLISHYSNFSNVKIISSSEAFSIESDAYQTWSTARILLFVALLLFLMEMAFLYLYTSKA